MTPYEIVGWLNDFRKRAGHNNARGCVVCITLNMLIHEIADKSKHDGLTRRVCEDGVIITEH